MATPKASSTSAVPDLEETGNIVKVPLLYGNAERWEGARKNGYIRDQRGRIQIPLVMFKRNSIERNNLLSNFKEVNKIATYQKYSKKNINNDNLNNILLLDYFESLLEYQSKIILMICVFQKTMFQGLNQIPIIHQKNRF